MQFAIDAKKASNFRRTFADMKRSGLIQSRLLLLRHSFALQDILCPGGVHHFHAISVHLTKILIDPPGKVNKKNGNDATVDISEMRKGEFVIIFIVQVAAVS
jgi:hypothetical protein